MGRHGQSPGQLLQYMPHVPLSPALCEYNPTALGLSSLRTWRALLQQTRADPKLELGKAHRANRLGQASIGWP